MQIYNLTAWNDQTFQLTCDMSAWFAAYPDFVTASFQAFVAKSDQLAANSTAKAFALSFSTSVSDGFAGTITLDTAAKTLRLAAPPGAVRARVGLFQYVLQMNLDGRRIDIIGGQLEFKQGLPT